MIQFIKGCRIYPLSIKLWNDSWDGYLINVFHIFSVHFESYKDGMFRDNLVTYSRPRRQIPNVTDPTQRIKRMR